MLDWKLCSSDEMSNDEEAEQFDDTQHIVHIDDLQTADTNIETHSVDDFGSDAAKSSSTYETARDSTKLKFMEFGAKA